MMEVIDKMALVVQKYGGTSVKDAERVMNVARRITDTYKKGNSVVVAVSAQGDTTDDLIEKAKEINPDASKREMDMLLSTGEQISIALLAMAIEKLGYPGVSLTGWQCGMKTDSRYGAARIKMIDTERLRNELDKKRIVIVAGFQGINKYDDITTLGRGGSDTSAVALAAALHADLCEIYTCLLYTSSRTSERLVCSCCYNVCEWNRGGVNSCGNKTGNMRHINHQICAYLFGYRDVYKRQVL